jgi:hypothetical protein
MSLLGVYPAVAKVSNARAVISNMYAMFEAFRFIFTYVYLLFTVCEAVHVISN